MFSRKIVRLLRNSDCSSSAFIWGREKRRDGLRRIRDRSSVSRRVHGRVHSPGLHLFASLRFRGDCRESSEHWILSPVSCVGRRHKAFYTACLQRHHLLWSRLSRHRLPPSERQRSTHFHTPSSFSLASHYVSRVNTDLSLWRWRRCDLPSSLDVSSLWLPFELLKRPHSHKRTVTSNALFILTHFAHCSLQVLCSVMD